MTVSAGCIVDRGKTVMTSCLLLKGHIVLFLHELDGLFPVRDLESEAVDVFVHSPLDLVGRTIWKVCLNFQGDVQ